jgi:NAD+ synthase (glutamine-hydrolysing)
VKVLAAQINPIVGDVEGNGGKVVAALRRAKEKGAEMVLFPELTLSGYFPEDLLLDNDFLEAIEKKLEAIVPETKGLFVALGLPRKSGKEKPLYNSAAILIDGRLVGYKNKTLLPTYDVFDERRYFQPDAEAKVWEYKGLKIGVAICEDVWPNYDIDPVHLLKEKKPDLLLNLSGSPYSFKRHETRLSIFEKAAKTLQCPVLFCNQVGANDQIIYDGHSFCLDGKGNVGEVAKGFEEDDLLIDLSHLKKSARKEASPISDLYSALVLGLSDYMHKQGFKKALIGLSGGIDSALVACIAKDALGAKNVTAVALPSRYSSKESLEDAEHLANILGIELKQISIEPIFEDYLRLLDPKDVAQENLQTRIRATILMTLSNQTGSLLLNTSNKSEIAMGYCTLYGDMAGAISVLQDVFKLQVYELAEYVKIIPRRIVEKVPSAELKEGQTDSDTLPKYEILDPILEDYLERNLTPVEIAKKRKHPLHFVQDIIHKVHLAEYKRRQAPMGLRVSLKAFDKGRIVPIVQKFR